MDSFYDIHCLFMVRNVDIVRLVRLVCKLRGVTPNLAHYLHYGIRMTMLPIFTLFLFHLIRRLRTWNRQLREFILNFISSEKNYCLKLNKPKYKVIDNIYY